jgi:hypothetical protein
MRAFALVVVTSLHAGATAADKPVLPAEWHGTRAGELVLFRADGKSTKVPLTLTIKPLDAGGWAWKAEYSGDRPVVKDYELVPGVLREQPVERARRGVQFAKRVRPGAADANARHALVPTQIDRDNRVTVHRKPPTGAGDYPHPNAHGLHGFFRRRTNRARSAERRHGTPRAGGDGCLGSRRSRMRRTLWVAVAGTVLSVPLVNPVAVEAPVACAAPVPPDRRAPLYFPTAVGATWVYQLNDGREYTDVVTAVDHEQGHATVSVSVIGPDGKLHPSYRNVVSARGILRVEGIGIKKDRPEWRLKLPYTVDEVWETGGEWDEYRLFQSQRSTHTSAGGEVVSVPAGTFKALRVTTKHDRIPGCMLGPTPPSTCWYAPGVGVVKITMDKTVWVLKSFEPGGK